MLSFDIKKLFGKSQEAENAQKGFLAVFFDAQGFSIVHVDKQDALNPKVKLCDYVPCASEREFEEKLIAYVQQHHLQGVQTTFILQAGQYRLIYLDAPKVPHSELATASRFLVKDLIDFPLNDAVVDAFLVPVRPGQTEKIYVVVSNVSTLEKIVGMIDTAKLKLTCIDIPELALGNFISFLEQKKASKGAVAESKPAEMAAAPNPVTPVVTEAPPATTSRSGNSEIDAILAKHSEDLQASLNEGEASAAPVPAPETTDEPAPTAGSEKVQASETQQTPVIHKERKEETALLLLCENYSGVLVNREEQLCLSREVQTQFEFGAGTTAESQAESLARATKEIERSVTYYQSHLSAGELKDFWVLTELEQEKALADNLQGIVNGDVKSLDITHYLTFIKKPDRFHQALCLIALGGALREGEEAL